MPKTDTNTKPQKDPSEHAVHEPRDGSFGLIMTTVFVTVIVVFAALGRMIGS